MEASKSEESHTCYICAFIGVDEHWVMAGYDEFGPVWICSKCRKKQERGRKTERGPKTEDGRRKKTGDGGRKKTGDG